MTSAEYFHECCECGEELCELDRENGKPVLIFDDGGWFCRECWKEMDKKREQESEAAA